MAVQDISIQQGATFIYTIPLNDANGNPLNVTGYSANAACSKDVFSANLNNVIVFQCFLVNGSLTLRLESTVTANMWPGTWQYDVTLTSGSNVYRVQEGFVDIDPGITGVVYQSVANTEW